MKTFTQMDDEKTRNKILPFLNKKIKALNLTVHIEYVLKQFKDGLSSKMTRYYSAQPWIFYWLTTAFRSLTSDPLPQGLPDQIVDYLLKCQHKKGGICGGPGQSQQLISSYAAVLAIKNLRQERLGQLNKEGMQQYLLRIKTVDNFFEAHELGQTDLRCLLSAVLISNLLNLDKIVTQGCIQTILACQTYEGGFSNIPGGQAHAGFTYCALAALNLLGAIRRADLARLMKWLKDRQTAFGGFNGRTNKLVDTCYNFWVGGSIVILEQQLGLKLNLYKKQPFLQYLKNCGQNETGGLRDKPGCNVDYYHTCYGLLGVSVMGLMQSGITLDSVWT